MLPTAYYKDDKVAIYNMDCIAGMNELPEGLGDLIFTSPPYNVGEKYEQGMPFGDYLKLLADCYAAALRVIKKGGYCIMVYDDYYIFDGSNTTVLPMTYLHHLIGERSGWQHKCTRYWEKDYASLADPYTVASTLPKGEIEFISTFRKPGGGKEKVREQDIHPRQLWSTAGIKQTTATRKHHAAAFPERLVEMALAVYADKDDTIIEPFLGSGTTLAVAKKLGLRGIGFELDPEFCDIAAVRCSQEVMLFDAASGRLAKRKPSLLDDAVPLPVKAPDDF